MALDKSLIAGIDRALEKHSQNIISLGESIWQNPETGFREFETSELVSRKLRELGLPVRSGLALTGVRAELDTGRPGPTVAVIGELDALLQPLHPAAKKETGAAHSCGHHTHAAAMYGAAAVLSTPEILSQLSGKIVFVAAPAEEGIELEYRKQLFEAGKIRAINGKPALIAEGVFDDVDIAFMNHASGGCGTTDANGFVYKAITIKGLPAHGCYTQNGRNTLNAMDLTRHAIALLRESEMSRSPYSRIHGIISSGGEGISTTPSECKMEFMLRAPDTDTLRILSKNFDQAVSHSCLACRCGVEIKTFPGEMPLLNSPELAAVYREQVEEDGGHLSFNTPGAWDKGSTDMGDLSQIMPAIHINVPGSNNMNHKDDFCIVDPYKAYILNCRLLVKVTCQLLCDSAARAKEILRDFKPALTREEYRKITDLFSETLSLPIPE